MNQTRIGSVVGSDSDAMLVNLVDQFDQNLNCGLIVKPPFFNGHEDIDGITKTIITTTSKTSTESKKKCGRK